MVVNYIMLSMEKDNVQVKLKYDLSKGLKPVFQVEDTRNDELKNVYFINETKARQTYDEKVKEIA